MDTGEPFLKRVGGIGPSITSIRRHDDVDNGVFFSYELI